jgi:hypothetical protein
MFEAVTIVPTEIDVGQIAEAMVYYGRVNLVCARGLLPKLMDGFGYENLIRCMDQGFLNLTYERNGYAAATVSNPFPVHAFIVTSLGKTANGKEIKHASEDIEAVLQNAFGKSADNRAKALNLGRRAHVRKGNAEVIQMAQALALDAAYVTNALKAMAVLRRPGLQLPADLGVDVFDTGQGIALSSNLKFEDFDTTQAAFFATILKTCEEIVFAGEEKSDLWMPEFGSRLFSMRASSVLNQINQKKDDVVFFERVKFNGRMISEVVNEGAQPISALIDLLENKETRKFKEWLWEQDQNASLMEEYDRAVFSEGWTKTIPTKVSKLTLFAGLGAILDLTLGTHGVATGVATSVSAAAAAGLGLGDEFILPKLLGGWKPNQFIEGPAADFMAHPDMRD